MLCRCCCRHFENLKSLRYGMISLSRFQCALTIILHSVVNFAAVKWTVFTQATRQMLLNDARRAGVNLLLSKPGGPALQGF